MLDGGRLSILGRRALYIIRCRKVELELTEASETFEFVELTTRVVVVTTTVVMVVPKNPERRQARIQMFPISVQSFASSLLPFPLG